jgi:hypothetical protein
VIGDRVTLVLGQPVLQATHNLAGAHEGVGDCVAPLLLIFQHHALASTR